uniref:Uncharacterized protein n=1 Tax=Lactuca sativa TaxID=4236 RepID=A0A9R1X563_LACSA|nr:hypothetical protein LSAT_V11C700384130 [Lactuca sativa]
MIVCNCLLIVFRQGNGSVRYTKWIQQKVSSSAWSYRTWLLDAKQLTVTEYVNMLFFINKNNMKFFSRIGDGKVKYTTDDIDEIREEW